MPVALAASVDKWLAWLETLHPADIELGLERVAVVADRLALRRPPIPIITVAGTNGKGSVCGFLEAILLAGGYRPGVYTSPHLARYHERVRVGGREIDSADLVTSFEHVESARGNTALTFFEFATLAALAHFQRAQADVIILETGLGGRLDATNIVDADVAIITSIGLDHMEWLGTDRNAIAREKAGIGRPGQPMIVAEPDPPDDWPAIVAAVGAREIRAGRDYWTEVAGDSWSWHSPQRVLADLRLPTASQDYQRANAAAAIAGLVQLGPDWWQPAALASGVTGAQIPGRFEVIAGPVEVILDVGHNPQAATQLAASLAGRPTAGRTLLVIGMYRDKDVEQVTAQLAPMTDRWLIAGLEPPRGLSAAELANRISARSVNAHWCDTPEAALRAAWVEAAPGDRIVVTGSFATVARVRALFL